MPCEYYMPGEEEALKAAALKTELDKVTATADVMREYIIAQANGENPTMPKEILTKIKRDQIEHRKMDLKRLEDTFIKSKNTKGLELVWAADPKQPLEPQLGFDPDAY